MTHGVQLASGIFRRPSASATACHRSPSVLNLWSGLRTRGVYSYVTDEATPRHVHTIWCMDSTGVNCPDGDAIWRGGVQHQATCLASAFPGCARNILILHLPLI